MSDDTPPDVVPSEGAVPEAPETDAAPVSEDELRERLVAVLKTVFDPEIPVDIWELGLVYDVRISEDRSVEVRMTLTSPACPVAGSLPGEVETRLREVPGVKDVRIELVWDPPWDPSRMSETARLILNLPY